MDRIRFDRLLTLADFLEKLPEGKFNYCSYVGYEWNGASSALECGTTACALGWATAIPEFRAEGLCLRSLSSNGRIGTVALTEGGNEYAASKKVFGLNSYEHAFLFLPGENDISEDASAKEVAAHIRKFVESGGQVDYNDDYDDPYYDEGDDDEDEVAA